MASHGLQTLYHHGRGTAAALLSVEARTLHTLATPYSPFLSACTSVTIMREPELPIGWPSETPPPSVFTLLASRSRICMLASATAENASLISNSAICSLDSPARSSARGIASAGAMGKSIGLRAASAVAG